MTAGAVLTGGASRRMGRDKALIRHRGRPLAAGVAAALTGAGCAPVVLIGGDATALAGTGHPVVSDEWPGGGPLGGVITALRHLRDDTVVAACDLPGLDATAVATLLAAGGVAPVVARTDRIQPSLTWWPVGSLERLEPLWAEGVRAMGAALARLGAIDVALPAAALVNANHPADLPR